MAALLLALQQFEDDILVDVKNVHCRHVWQRVDEVREGGEAGVGGEQG